MILLGLKLYYLNFWGLFAPQSVQIWPGIGILHGKTEGGARVPRALARVQRALARYRGCKASEQTNLKQKIFFKKQNGRLQGGHLVFYYKIKAALALEPLDRL